MNQNQLKLYQFAEQQALNLERLSAYGLRRTLHGFYYISHYFPLRAMNPVSEQEATQLLDTLETDTFEVYLHYPYCEQFCTFCHFYKEIPKRELEQKEARILELLEKEMALHKARNGGPIHARSLQLGGGTPSLISNEGLKRLLEAVCDNFEFIGIPELKTEVFPRFYDEREIVEKLRILKDFGFQDIVVDLESGNKRTLDFIGRKSSSLEAYLRLLELIGESGFPTVISALMCGLPYESRESFANTLEVIRDHPLVRVINTFPLIVRKTDPIARQLEKFKDTGVSAFERDILWVYARNFLREMGYVEGPISYLHAKDKRPDQQSDKFECVNLLGLGVSAFGYLNGKDWAAQYYNYANFSDYASAVSAGKLPIWRAGPYDQTERARRKVIFGLANVKTENLHRLESTYGISVDEVFGRIFNALLALGLIEVDQSNNGIRYTEDGLCRLEEISYHLGSRYAKDRADSQPSPLDKHFRELINQHYQVSVEPQDREAFEQFVNSQSDRFMVRLVPGMN